MAEERFAYGGQAVIEGVMIRGRRFLTMAVRRPRGDIHVECQPLSSFYTGPLRRIPLVRGILTLIEMLILGMRALNRSAIVALEEEFEGHEQMSKWAMGITLVVALAFGIAIFFVGPLLLAHTMDAYISSSVASNLVEGLIRVAVLLAYVWVVGYMKDIRRVFGYHGAEHKAVHAHEAGLPLEPASLKPFSTAHARCGTAFLLVVMVVSIIVFTFMGRPGIEWRIASRVLMVPVIAAISYEIIRFSGRHQANRLVRLIMTPNLWLQKLTTREPDERMMEVAIKAMEAAVAADEGRMPVTQPVAAATEGAAPEVPAQDAGSSPAAPAVAPQTVTQPMASLSNDGSGPTAQPPATPPSA